MQKEEVVRKSFRLPMAGPDAIKVIIDGEMYDLVDVGARGLGIRVPRSDTFALGEKLTSIRLTIEKKTFNVDGIVVHISADSSDFFLCGILLELNPIVEKKFEEHVNRYRANIFTGR